MISFRIVGHSEIPGRQVVEVWDDNRFLATITGQDEARGIRITSKHFAEGLRGEFLESINEAMAVTGFGIVKLRTDPVPTIELYIIPPERNRGWEAR